jgi:hypothetical protein
VDLGTLSFLNLKAWEVVQNEGYYPLSDRWSFLDAALTEYAALIESLPPQVKNQEVLICFINELSLLKGTIEELFSLARHEITPTAALKLINETSTTQDDINSYRDLGKSIDEAASRHNQLLKLLQAKLTVELPVIGFKNLGNTCYINASLQPLLAIKSFPELIPEVIARKENESDAYYEGRKKVIAALKKIVDAWSEKASTGELGRLVASFRRTIFEAQLQEGGFYDMSRIESFYDAGSIFELVLFVIGQQFNLKTSKRFTHPNEEDYVSESTTLQGCLYLKDESSCIQEKVNKYAKPHSESLDEPFVIPNKSVAYQSLTETNKIVGQAPDILVLRLDDQSAYSVDPHKDSVIHFADLFENGSHVQYELVGFAQNHHQAHWTCVVKREEWTYCNDERIEKVTPQDSQFKHPANYLIYKKSE